MHKGLFRLAVNLLQPATVAVKIDYLAQGLTVIMNVVPSEQASFFAL